MFSERWRWNCIALDQRLLEQQQQQTKILDRLKAVEVEQDRFNTPCGHKEERCGFR
jgi:hypothetical protein